jgi:hypothetical protein
MPFEIDQNLIQNTPGGIAGGGGMTATGGGGAGMGAPHVDIKGLLDGLLGAKAPAPGGVVGQGPNGEDLMGAPTMQRQGGLLSGLMPQGGPPQGAPPQGAPQQPPAGNGFSAKLARLFSGQ